MPGGLPPDLEGAATIPVEDGRSTPKIQCCRPHHRRQQRRQRAGHRRLRHRHSRRGIPARPKCWCYPVRWRGGSISQLLAARSELSLVPCTQDFLRQAIPHVTAQFLVYNEFEQRFSTSRAVDCLLSGPISRIDTSQPNRSIFSASVAGTVAGQTRITGVNGGLIGAATLSLCEPDLTGACLASFPRSARHTT
jgi:hypothetical protein